MIYTHHVCLLRAVGGYPIVFHQLHALQRLRGTHRVSNVFLHGKYAEEDFAPFIDSVITKFDFNIVYVHEAGNVQQVQGLSALYKHRQALRADNPSYLLVMNCDSCSSLPIANMLSFHEQKQA